MDIAGLVKGASKGEGLGNKFLSNIREVDAIVHVVRCFENDDIIHVEGSIDPKRDIETIDLELILSDMEVLDRHIDKTKKMLKADKKYQAELDFLERVHQALEEGKSARSVECTEEEAEILSTVSLLTNKPIIFAANMSEDDLLGGMQENPHYQTVKRLAEGEGAKCIPICAKTEEDIADYSPEEKKAFLAEMGIEATGLDNLIQASYSLLGLISFLTDGKKECRAWTIRAGTIHSDFERGFIRASVVAYDDFAACGFSMAAVKAKGLQRTEGKEYVVKDGDIIEFLFNV